MYWPWQPLRPNQEALHRQYPPSKLLPTKLFGLQVTPIILGLCTTAFGVLTTRLYVEFGWAIFHLVGASPAMKRESLVFPG